MTKNGMRPIHPGEILRKEFLKPLEMSVNALTKALDLYPARVNEIVREERGITPDSALRQARFFDTTPKFWLNLQMEYDLKKAQEASMAEIMEKVHPLGNDRTFALTG
jgi:addiction module HigA family antidote